MGSWLAEHHERIAMRFRRKTDTAWLEDLDGTLRAHFLVSWSQLVNDGNAEPYEKADRKDRLHAETIQRVALLRGLFPNRAGYGCQGYGHQLLPMPYDSTTKTSIKAAGLPPPWAVRVNGSANALIEWRFRPVEWTDYLSQVQTLREEMTAVMRDLRRSLVAHFRNKRKRQLPGNHLDSKAWDRLKQKLSQSIPLPRQAVDEWGFVSEGKETTEQNSASRIERGFALTAFRPYIKCQSDLFNGLDNFLEQALPHLYLHCANGKVGTDISRILIEAKVKESGGNLVSPGLTAHNLADAVFALPRFQREFRRLFGSRLPADQLDEQDRRERKVFDAALALWSAYLYQPTAHWQQPERRAIARMWQEIDQVPQKLARALTSLESEGIRARILKQPERWENAPALWISLDSDAPLHVFAAYVLAKPLLRQAVLDANLDDEQTRMLPRRWEQVVFVPLYRGRALDQQAWLVPSYRLTSHEPSTEFEWLDHIPRAVSEEDWTRTSIQCWISAEMTDAREFLVAIGCFKILTHHLSSVLALAQTDDADRDVLQDYLERYQAEWSGIIQALIDGIAALAERYNLLSNEEQEQRPFLAEAAVMARDNYHSWLPPGLEQGRAILSVDVCTSWLSTTTANIEALDTVGGALLLDSVVQTAMLSDTESSISA